MSKYTDPDHNNRLYGIDGISGRCQECAQPADYLERPNEDSPWAEATPWCRECRPSRGRRPHHGERFVRAELFARSCAQPGCEQTPVTATTAPGDPHLSQVRRGRGLDDLAGIMARATPYCAEHLPVIALGPQRAAAQHPFADAERMRAVLNDPRATSLTQVGRLMGVADGGTTTQSLIRNHKAHTEADPTFPPLPAPRSQAEWGALAWVGRRSDDASESD